MAKLDIRDKQEEEITRIQFDGTMDRLAFSGSAIKMFKKSTNSDVYLCAYADLDNFIAACKKAKELWQK